MHLAWRQAHPDLKHLPYPMLADTKRELSTALGILHKTDGVALHGNPDLERQVARAFKSEAPLSACTYCLGTSAPKAPRASKQGYVKRRTGKRPGAPKTFGSRRR